MLHKNFGHFDHYWSLMDHWIYDSMGSPPLLCRFYRLVTDNLNLALCPILDPVAPLAWGPWVPGNLSILNKWVAEPHYFEKKIELSTFQWK